MQNKQNDVIQLKGKTYEKAELVNQLIYIPANIIVGFFSDLGLNVPRQLRINALRETLAPSAAKTREERQSLADEMGFRLSFFHRFSETQLVNLLEYYNDNGIRKQYFTNLWKELLDYLIQKGVHENDVMRLVLEGDRYSSVKERQIPSSLPFNNEINVLFFDEEGKIDGLTPEQFRPVMYLSSTLTELRTVGDKYNASVPKRLRKKDVQQIVIAELADRGELTEELKEELLSKNIMVLERFAKDNDIKVSTELRKEEVIEYILKNAKETSEQYFEPVDNLVYEMSEEEVVEEPVEIVEEPVLETPAEEVTKAEPTTIVYNQESIKPELSEVVKELREINSNLREKEKVVATVNPNNNYQKDLHEELKYNLLKDEENDLNSSEHKVPAGASIIINNNINVDAASQGKRSKPKSKFGKFMRALLKTIKWLIIIAILYVVALFILIGVDTFTTNAGLTNFITTFEKGISWLDLGGKHLGEHIRDLFLQIKQMFN